MQHSKIMKTQNLRLIHTHTHTHTTSTRKFITYTRKTTYSWPRISP